MDKINTTSKYLKARHVLFIIDACYSGIAGGTVSKGSIERHTPDFMAARMGKRGRQIMTAGMFGEEAFQLDVLKMSVYSYYLKEGLKGSADHNHDNLITMSEIQSFLERKVSDRTYNRQNPQYRDLMDTGGGEFVFIPKAYIGGEDDWNQKQEELQRELASAGAEREKAEALAKEFEARRRADQIEKKIAEEKRRKKEAERKARELQAKAKDETDSQELQEPGNKVSFMNSIGMKFVYIRSGVFTMGSPSDEPARDGDEKQHQVTLTRGFYIGETEVIQGQWRKVMKNNPSYFKNCGDDCPVESVSWNDVQDFIRKLNSLEGTNRYRLPTEAEWEYACRAGSQTAFANGAITDTDCGKDPNLGTMGWYCGNAGGGTHPVARKTRNAWDLYDMHGNVWEWCQDRYGDYPAGSDTDPEGPFLGLHRVLRGGSWFNVARSCRSADRSWLRAGGRSRDYGFRLVLLPGQ